MKSKALVALVLLVLLVFVGWFLRPSDKEDTPLRPQEKSYGGTTGKAEDPHKERALSDHDEQAHEEDDQDKLASRSCHELGAGHEEKQEVHTESRLREVDAILQQFHTYRPGCISGKEVKDAFSLTDSGVLIDLLGRDEYWHSWSMALYCLCILEPTESTARLVDDYIASPDDFLRIRSEDLRYSKLKSALSMCHLEPHVALAHLQNLVTLTGAQEALSAWDKDLRPWGDTHEGYVTTLRASAAAGLSYLNTPEALGVLLKESELFEASVKDRNKHLSGIESSWKNCLEQAILQFYAIRDLGEDEFTAKYWSMNLAETVIFFEKYEQQYLADRTTQRFRFERENT